MNLCFATNNVHKLAEAQTILGNHMKLVGLKDIGCFETLPETSNTIAGNSFQKAEYVWKKYHVDCFADDSGLEIDALGGAPGVHSAYYAGQHRSDEDNIALVLKNLANQSQRRAQFKTVITLFWKGSPYQFEGIIEGVILNEKRGTNGFGYDPIFQPKGYALSFAEMRPDEKNAISHRAIAIKKLASFLQAC